MLHPVENAEALFHREGDLYVPTRYTQGPWDPGHQFGGSPAALLATLVEQVPTLVPMQIARLSVDLLRPVPLEPLTADVRIVREGKRIQVVAASLLAGVTEVARCSALRIRLTDLGDHDLPTGVCPNPVPSGPLGSDEEPFPVTSPPGSRLAVEYLFEGVGGYFRNPIWVRLRVDVIAGQPPGPVARLAYTADLASGIGQTRGLPVRAINADLSLNVLRHPEGEWLSLGGQGWMSRAGIGQVQANISDTLGLAATVSMARLVDPIT
jgi:acyl-CoA thioesterase superfamily protein/acyl-Coa thioesterase superfamily protein